MIVQYSILLGTQLAVAPQVTTAFLSGSPRCKIMFKNVNTKVQQYCWYKNVNTKLKLESSTEHASISKFKDHFMVMLSFSDSRPRTTEFGNHFYGHSILYKVDFKHINNTWHWSIFFCWRFASALVSFKFHLMLFWACASHGTGPC